MPRCNGLQCVQAPQHQWSTAAADQAFNQCLQQKKTPFAHEEQQAAQPSSKFESCPTPASACLVSRDRESSCPLPDTPQPALPSIRTRRSDSNSMAVDSPMAAALQQQAPPADSWSQPSEGWFFNCRGCGCMTAYEQSFGPVDVPFCRRCQVMFVDACPAMKAKMVETLLYVHDAWSNAGL